MSKKQITTAEQYQKAVEFLKQLAKQMDDPLSSKEEREKAYKLFIRTTELMDEYQDKLATKEGG